MKKFLSNSSIKSGKQLKSDGDYPSAIKAFTKSIKREPENLEAYYQLGLIFEEVLHDYDKAISLYKNIIRLSEGIKPVGTDEELKEFNTLIKNARVSLDRAIGQKFESIEKPKVPVYIMVKPYQKILTEPKMFSYSKYKTTSYASEFKLLDFNDNWYQINVPSTGSGWVNGKNVLKITQKEKKVIETSPAGKAALYQRFADLYPDSRFAQNAKYKADDIYYGLAKEEGSINSYSMYLRNNPNGKYAKEVRLKMDELTFHDESFFNNINRLRHWINNNPESTFIEKARKRIDELTFVQAKYDNNTVSLEGYIIDYPDGKFVSEAKQLIEDIKYNHAKFKDTINSYRKYLDEYPDGRYAENAAKRIDEKEFSTLLNSQDIELLVEHLKDETNEERIELVKNRIEELYFKKAGAGDKEAVKLFLKSGIRPNAKDSIGQTALMLAAQNGHIEICKALVKAGGDVNIEDENGKTALIIVAEKGYTDIVKTLIQSGANLINKSSALCFASAYGHTEIAMFLIKNGADINVVTENGRTPLILALSGKRITSDADMGGYPETANALIHAGADINVKTYVGITEQKIFFSAIYQGFTEVVKAFIKAGQTEIIKILQEAGAKLRPDFYDDRKVLQQKGELKNTPKKIHSLEGKIESNHSQLLISKTNPRVRIETNYGIITLELYTQKAPKTIENFLQYVRDGFYGGTIFHRVIKGFMVQGGGLNANMQKKPTRNPIINEADNGLKNLRGTIAMARSKEPHSATSQFIINTANNTSLDYKEKNPEGWGYCVFGKVVEGMGVVNTIENLPTITKGKYHDVPANPVIIESAIVENDNQQSNYTTSGNNEKSDISNKVSSSVFATNNSNLN